MINIADIHSQTSSLSSSTILSQSIPPSSPISSSSNSSRSSTHPPVIDFDSTSPESNYTLSTDSNINPIELDLDFNNSTTLSTDQVSYLEYSPIAVLPRHHHQLKQYLMGRNENDNDYELRIAAGIKLVKSGTMSIRAAAKKVKVSHETLRRRHQGASSRHEFHTQLMALTPAEELNIENMIMTFISYSNMLTSSFLCNLVNDYRRQKATEQDPTQPPLKDLGISWTAGFRRRHETVSEIMSKSMNKEKIDGQTKSTVDQWYADISTGFQTYNISPQNVYNLVEMGYYSTNKVQDHTTPSSFSLICFKRLEFLKIVDPTDLALSSLDTICGDGSFLPSMVIVKGGSNTNLVSEATEEYGSLTSTIDGRANPTSFYDWLEYVFNPHTEPKANNGYRAIFLDGNPALFSAQVLQFALDHKIIFYLIPSQTNNILQPHDSAIMPAFRSNVMNLSQAHTVVSPTGKVSWDACFTILHEARLASMHKNNVLAAWQNTGVIPLNPSRNTNPDLSSPQPYSLTLQSDHSLDLPTTISMAMISNPSSITEPLPLPKTEPASPVNGLTLVGHPPVSPYTQLDPCVDQSSYEDQTKYNTEHLLSMVQDRLRRHSAIQENMVGLGAHYRAALDRYLGSRPPLYYGDGTRADIEEEQYLRQFMDTCWEAIDRAVQGAVDTNKKMLDWVDEMIK